MKYLLTALVLASGANAFVPSSTLNKASTAMYVSWDTSGQTFADDKWYYKPWGGITEDTFYPQSQAGNRMCFFPPPTQTVGAASSEGPAAAAAPPLPEATAAAPMPEMDASAAAPMPEMDASTVSANV
jgi:hypothetical protein